MDTQMKSRYQNELILQLTHRIARLQSASERGEAAAPSASDVVTLALDLSRIELTADQFERVTEQVNAYWTRYSPSADDLSNRIIGWVWGALDHKAQLRAQFEQWSVEADSVEDFLVRFHKSGEASPSLLSYHQAAFDEYGYTSLGTHETIIGEIVSLMRLTPTTKED
jgi:hypothetical protein